MLEVGVVKTEKGSTTTQLTETETHGAERGRGCPKSLRYLGF